MLRTSGSRRAWEVIVGDPDFYAAVARLEQSLTGLDGTVTDATLATWAQAAGRNAAALPLDADLVMVHDLAPLPLVRHRPRAGQWVWRCHGDLSHAHRRAWHLVRRDLERYDAAIFSLPKFAPRAAHPDADRAPVDRSAEREEPRPAPRRGRADPRSPAASRATSPCSSRWRPTRAARIPSASSAPTGSPASTSTAGSCWPGGGATDNPEGQDVLAEVREAALGDPDVHVARRCPADAALEINALQRAAAVVVHLPRHEDFGLGVAEAMWKGKPVIGSLAGGIPAQVIPEITGFIVTSTEGAAFRIRQLLENPELMARLGGAAREYVRRAFLITRHLGRLSRRAREPDGLRRC